MLQLGVVWFLRKSVVPSEIEVLPGEKKILRKADEMEDDVSMNLYAMWCVMEYGPRLRKYFERLHASIFQKADVTLHRLINVSAVGPNNVAEHLCSAIEEIKAKKYHVSSTSHRAYECMIIDRDQALLLIPHAVRRVLYWGLFSEDEHFVNSMAVNFGQLENEGVPLDIPPDADDLSARTLIKAWIDKVAEQ